jgi:hypothetical protein
MQHVLAAVTMVSEDWANYRIAAGSRESDLCIHYPVATSIAVNIAY